MEPTHEDLMYVVKAGRDFEPGTSPRLAAEDAYAALYNRLRSSVYAIISGYGIPDWEAVVQDVLMRLWTHCHQWHHGEVMAWLCRVAHNRARDMWRRERRYGPTIDALSDRLSYPHFGRGDSVDEDDDFYARGIDAPDEAPTDPLDLLERQELRDEVRSILGRLTERDRSLLIASVSDEPDWVKRWAAHQPATRQAIKSAAHRARYRFQEAWRQRIDPTQPATRHPFWRHSRRPPGADAAD